MHPLVSVIIPFYNDPYVGEALASALAQTYPEVEIIVVNDGSTEHADKIAPYLNRILYLVKSNGGTASALNHGIRASSGEYIAWLSSDDRFYPRKLSVQIPRMQAAGAMISHTAFDLIDEHGRITQPRVTHPYRDDVSFYTAMLSCNPVNGCTVVMHRRLLKKVGLFDSALPYTHDVDLWYRIMLAGCRFEYIDEPLTQYRWHSQMGTVRHRPVIEQELAATRAKYAGRMANYIRSLGGR